MRTHTHVAQGTVWGGALSGSIGLLTHPRLHGRPFGVRLTLLLLGGGPWETSVSDYARTHTHIHTQTLARSRLAHG